MQDGDRQIEWQVQRTRGFNPIAQGQLVHDDLVFAQQLALLDLVFEVERELAGSNLAARESGRIGRQIGHLDIAEHHFDVHEPGRIEQIDLTDRACQAEFIHLTVDFQFRQSAWLGGYAVECAFQRVNPSTEWQGQRIVGELHLAVFDADAVYRQPEGIGVRCGVHFRRRLSRRGCADFNRLSGLCSRRGRIGLLWRHRHRLGGCIGRFHDPLQIGALVLEDDQLGVEFIHTQFVDIQRRRTGAHAIAGEPLPGQEARPAFAFIEQQVGDLEAALEVDFRRRICLGLELDLALR